MQGAAGQTVRRSKCCFGLGFEQRSPPEGPLAQSWGNQARTILLGRLLPQGEPWAGQRQLSGCIAHLFLSGSTLKSPWVNTWVQLFQRSGLDLLGRGWEANAGSTPSPKGTGEGRRAAPHVGVPPWHVAITATVRLDCLLKSNSCTVMARSCSPCFEPRLGTTELPGEQSPVLIFKETTHPPCSGSSCRRCM